MDHKLRPDLRGRQLLIALAVVALAGCGIGGLFGPQGGPYPGACAKLGFAPRQCAAIVTRAAAQSGVKAADASAIDILPPTDTGGGRILSGGMISRVRFHLPDSTERTEEVWCVGVGGGGADYACNADPTIEIGAPYLDHDVPCATEESSSCATLPPTPRPESQAQARPLRLPAIDIPLDHLGSYRIDLGEAGLPDGAFTRSSATVVDPRPTTFWIQGAQLVVEPVDPARPRIGSIYREPFDGVEPVRVTLEFDVTEVSPGAVLQVRDIVVE